jgi:dihydropteroate synthase
MIVVATLSEYRRTLEELRRRPAPDSDLAEALEAALAQLGALRPREFRGVHRSFGVGGRTRVMAVLNLTPDSFSDGGEFSELAPALARASEVAGEGADLIDLGAESTRPGSAVVSPAVEWKRLEPVLARLHATSPIPLSVDTRHAEVARKALDSGADLINDVSGLRDPEMRRLLARSGAPVVVMHMRGTPGSMQADTTYTDLRGEVFDALAEAVATALEEGVGAEQILIDPGLGFGKSAAQSLELLRHLGEFRTLGYPVVVGASRKSFLGAALGGAGPKERLEAGLAAAVSAALQGAAVVRTHDVRPTVRALRVADALRRGAFASESADSH